MNNYGNWEEERLERKKRKDKGKEKENEKEKEESSMRRGIYGRRVVCDTCMMLLSFCYYIELDATTTIIATTMLMLLLLPLLLLLLF